MTRRCVLRDAADLAGFEREQRRLGEAKGLIEIKPDFDRLPDEFMAHFT